MIERKKFIDLLSRVRKDIAKEVMDYVYKIVTLAEKSRYLGDQFTFHQDEELDKEVNRLLVLLGDEILSEVYRKAEELVEEEDKEEVFLWLTDEGTRADLFERVDLYNSHLKYISEGWLAIGFAGGLSAGAIISKIRTFMLHPLASKEWRDAFNKGYQATILQEGSMEWGKGVQKSPLEGLTLIEQTTLTEAWQRGVLSGYGRGGAIGYVIHRGSTYDCPLCDSFCNKVYPLDELMLPIHPRCCCYTTPVYAP